MSAGERKSDIQTVRLICKDIDLKLETLTGQGGNRNIQIRGRAGTGMRFYPTGRIWYQETSETVQVKLKCV